MKKKSILFILLFVLFTSIVLYRWQQDSIIRTVTPDECSITERFSECIDFAAKEAVVPKELENGETEELLNYEEPALEKGNYEITVSYTADTEDNYALIESPFEMDEEGDPGAEYGTVTLSSESTSQTMSISIPEDTPGVYIHIYYHSGDLKIRSITIKETASCKDAIWLYAFFLIFVLSIYYLAAIRYKGDDNKNRRIVIYVLTAAILYASLPLYNDFYIQTHDGEFHLARIKGIYEALRDGHFPMWINMSQLGNQGYATPVMYPQMFLYIPALLRLCGMSLLNAYKTFLFMENTAGILIAYFSFKKIFGHRGQGLIAALSYSLGIYYLCNIYTRGAVGEALAMVFLPLLLYSFYEVYIRDYSKWPLLVLSITFIVQSHVLSTFIDLLAAGVFGIVLLPYMWKNNGRKRAMALLKSAVCAAAVNAFFLVPFLSYYQEDFNFHDKMEHSMTLCSLYLSQIFANRVNGCAGDVLLGSTADEMPHSVGIYILAVLILLIGILMSYTKDTAEDMRIKRMGRYFIMATIIPIFCTLWIFPWDLIERTPILNMLTMMQVPWRLLGIASLFGSGCAGMLLYFAARCYPQWIKQIGLIVLLFAVWNSADYMQSLQDAATVENKSEVALMGNSDALYMYHDTNLDETESAGNIVTSDIEGTILTGYSKKQTTVTVTYQLPEGEDTAVLELPLYYYPGYKGTCDGQDIVTGPAEDGRVCAVVNTNSGTVTVRFDAPWQWNAAYAVSGMTVLCLLAWMLVCRSRKQKEMKRIKSK